MDERQPSATGRSSEIVRFSLAAMMQRADEEYLESELTAADVDHLSQEDIDRLMATPRESGEPS